MNKLKRILVIFSTIFLISRVSVFACPKHLELTDTRIFDPSYVQIELDTNFAKSKSKLSGAAMAVGYYSGINRLIEFLKEDENSKNVLKQNNNFIEGFFYHYFTHSCLPENVYEFVVFDVPKDFVLTIKNAINNPKYKNYINRTKSEISKEEAKKIQDDCITFFKEYLTIYLPYKIEYYKNLSDENYRKFLLAEIDYYENHCVNKASKRNGGENCFQKEIDELKATLKDFEKLKQEKDKYINENIKILTETIPKEISENIEKIEKTSIEEIIDAVSSFGFGAEGNNDSENPGIVKHSN